MTSKVKAKKSSPNKIVSGKKASAVKPQSKNGKVARTTASKVEASLSKTVKDIEVKERAQRAGRTMTTRVSAKNQITIPVDIMRKAGFTVGDTVNCTVNEDGKIELARFENRIMTLFGAGNGIYDDLDWAKERADAWPE